MHTDASDQELMALLVREDEQALTLLFRRHYAYLCRVVIRIIPDEGVAEDLAQEVFLELWRRRKVLKINVSVQAYLRRSAVNRALNYLRDRKILLTDEEMAPPVVSPEPSGSQLLEARELQERIDRAINSLPERCRIVFVLSRFEDMSYQEIAAHLDISVKTVENQISKALRLLRQMLGLLLAGGLWALLNALA